MAINYTYIDLSTTTPASGLIRVQDSATSDWSAHGQTVEVGLATPTGSYTHYKLWGYSGYLTEGSASWTPVLASGTIFVNLDVEEGGIQYLSVKWAEDDEGTNETLLPVVSSGISYSWTTPMKQENLSWIALNDNHDESNTLRDSTNDIDFTMTDAVFDHLQFHNRDFTGIQMSADKITVTSGSQFWKLIEYDTNAYAEIKKTFPTDTRPFITMLVDGLHVPITKHDGTVKSGYTDRVASYSWNSGAKELDFNVYKFSTYGFTTLDEIAFALDSESSGYDGNSIQLKVRVTDDNNEGVESAPVTFSGIAGDNIGNFSVNPVNTDANGYATATLNLTSVGQATYEATVDSISTSPDQITTCITFPSDLQRSLLTQYEQIRFSAAYDDAIAGVNTQAVAEPSGSTDDAGADDVLQHDLNVIRTLIHDVVGGDTAGTWDWFTSLETYEDPTAIGTDKTANLYEMAGYTLDAFTIITAVEATNSGVGFTVSPTASGFLFNTNVGYADTTDKRGLCIFESTTNSGSYFDEGGIDDVCAIDLINTETGAEFTVSGTDDVLYAKFHDGADFGGTGEDYDVYVRFYSNDVPYVWDAVDPTNITMIFPRRKLLSEMAEHEWMRTDFVSRFEGDDAMVDDMVNLWAFTGGADNVTGPSWSNSGNYWLINSTDNLQQAIDRINDEVGDRDYSGYSYLSTDEEIVESLQALATQVKINEDAALTTAGDKYMVALASGISAETSVTLPASKAYTPEAAGGKEGQNMDVYFNGQLLSASTGVSGVNADRDYAELTATTIKFHEDLYQDDNITYVIRT